jgi:acetyltransferase
MEKPAFFSADGDFEGVATLPDGSSVHLRQLHAADEPLLYELARQMSQDDLRLRFFMPVRELDHAATTRLAHFDEAGKLGILALAVDADHALGVARFAAEPAGHMAEFALAVRSDYKRRGLGKLLLARLIAEAKRRGLTTLFGEVLRENAAMIALCRHFGFVLTHHPSDSRALRVTLPL